MRRQVILSPDAKEHVRSAIRWYADHQSHLRFRFKAELRTTLRRVVQNPYLFPLGEDQIRRALMRHFPYTIYFRLNGELVNVIGVIHQRRLSPWNTP
jgi:plasmid stabilization system protein ParE